MSVRDDSKIHDVRIIERNIRKGLLSRKDYARHIDGLHDCADKALVAPPAASEEVERIAEAASAGE